MRKLGVFRVTFPLNGNGGEKYTGQGELFCDSPFGGFLDRLTFGRRRGVYWEILACRYGLNDEIPPLEERSRASPPDRFSTRLRPT